MPDTFGSLEVKRKGAYCFERVYVVQLRVGIAGLPSHLSLVALTVEVSLLLCHSLCQL